MNEIIPAILPKTPEELAEKAAALPLEIPFVHLDVLEEDIWVPIDKGFEAHLLVEEPEKIANRWVERGAKRIIVHKVDDTIRKCRDNAEIGLAVDIDRPLNEFEPFFEYVDFVHLMSIDELGTQGDDFEPKVLDRIEEVKKKYPNIIVSVDGGISLENYKKVQEAGADRLIVGAHFREIWNSLTKS